MSKQTITSKEAMNLWGEGKVTVVVILPKPDEPCPCCKTDDWWELPNGGWMCDRCHPNPNNYPAVCGAGLPKHE